MRQGNIFLVLYIHTYYCHHTVTQWFKPDIAGLKLYHITTVARVD